MRGRQLLQMEREQVPAKRGWTKDERVGHVGVSQEWLANVVNPYP